MQKRQKIEYHKLKEGYEFPPARQHFDLSMVAAYIKAVGETSRLYQGTELIPPMEIAASTMAVLSESISMPAGAIHVSQELEFLNTVSIKDTITSYARVNRNQKRGNMHILTIELNVLNQDKKAVLSGKTSFILPEQVEGKGQ